MRFQEDKLQTHFEMIEDLLLKNVLKGESSLEKSEIASLLISCSVTIIWRLFSRAIWRHVFRIARRSPGREHGREIMMRGRRRRLSESTADAVSVAERAFLPRGCKVIISEIL